MTEQRSLMTRLLLTGAVVLALPVAALASPPAGEHYEHEMGAGPGMGGMPCEQHMLHRRGEWRKPDGEHMPPMLQSLDLSDAQRNQIREILRAQADTQRTRSEELHKTREALHDLTMSEDYSEAKVKELAAAQGRAVAGMVEQHAMTARRIHQLLTPEQRKQLQEHRKTCEEQRRQQPDDDDDTER